MKFTQTQFKHILFAIIILIASHTNSYAGGFPVRPHSLLLTPSVNYFVATRGWDSLRRLTPFPNNGKFTSLSYSLYAEYGISKRFTAVALLPFVTNTYQQSDYKNTATGLTDLETGIRYYFANINYIYYFTIQATAITPLYTNPSLGYGQSGAELKFAFAGSGTLFNRNYYFTAENGVRQYFGSSGPVQDRYNGTFGITLDRQFKNQVSVSIGGFYSSSSFKKFTPNQAVNKDFAFNQISLSYGYSFSKQFSVILTAGKFINGRNTGDGSSGGVSFIIRPF